MINWINIEDKQPSEDKQIWVLSENGKPIHVTAYKGKFTGWMYFSSNNWGRFTLWLDCIPTEITPANPEVTC